MPAILLNKTAIERLSDETLTWYSDRRFKGLRLAVTRNGKTWYVAKRNPVTGKVVSVRLGMWPELDVQEAHALATAEAGRIRKNAPKESTPEEDALPTFDEALTRYIKKRLADGRLSEGVAEEYRRLARNHLGKWLPKRLDVICRQSATLTDEMEALKASKPYAATKAVVVIGAVFDLSGKLHRNRGLFNPVDTVTLAKMEKRLIDHTVPWATRLAEINAVPNEVKRAAWLLLWHTGIRSGNLRALTWSNVDLDAKTVTLGRMKNKLGRTLPLSDYAVELLASLKARRDAHPKWVLPSIRNGVHLDQLDSLDSSTQHEMRHLYVTAAGLCHMPPYVIAFLKGDVVTAENQPMVALYLGNIGLHGAANAISAKILERCRT